jgi:hypothetical protein
MDPARFPALIVAMKAAMRSGEPLTCDEATAITGVSPLPLDAVRRCWKLSRIGCTAGNLPRPCRPRRRPARRAARAGSRRDTADDVEFQGTAPQPCARAARSHTAVLRPRIGMDHNRCARAAARDVTSRGCSYLKLICGRHNPPAGRARDGPL